MSAVADRSRREFVDVGLRAVESGLSVDELYRSVLGPLLKELGSRWQEGRLAVWEEHLASGFVRTLAEALYPMVAEESARADVTRGTVLLACPPGELHDLGLRLLSDRLELVGLRSVFLGADTPVRDIAAAARDRSATCILLSASTHLGLVNLRRTVEQLRELLPGVELRVGGPALIEGTPAPAERFEPEAFGLLPEVDEP